MKDTNDKPGAGKAKPHPVQILVNGHDVTMPDRTATVRDVRAVGGVPDGEHLYLASGGRDRRLDNLDEVLNLHPKMAFESSPDGGVS